MHKRRVLVLDLLTSGPEHGWYTRHVKIPNFSGVMSQAVAAWCTELGWATTLRTYTGEESPADLLAGDWGVAFIGAFSRAASTAYAIAAVLRSRGTVTALGGPHARAWPDDAARHFDYVLGLTDREVVGEVLQDRSLARDGAIRLGARRQPRALPGLARRAPFLKEAMRKASMIRVVPLLGSTGCPYSCDFCSDAEMEYAALPVDDLVDDVEFAASRFPGATVFWMDPSYGVRFDSYLSVVERSARARALRFGAEMTLSQLKPRNVERLAAAGFVAVLPGIESWHAYHQKTGLRRLQGQQRVVAVAEQLRGIAAAIPYVQVNLIFGIDGEDPAEACALTAELVHRCPEVWPNLNLLTVFGRSAPAGRAMYDAGRVLPLPFALLDQKTCLNALVDLDLSAFYLGLAELGEDIFGAKTSLRRVATSPLWRARVIHSFRAFGAEERRRLQWYRQVANWLSTDRAFRAFFEGETRTPPHQLLRLASRRLGPFAAHLPSGALYPCVLASQRTPSAEAAEDLAATSPVETITGEVSRRGPGSAEVNEERRG